MKYLTVKEAAELFDKPKMVIRRLVEILKEDEQLKQQWLRQEKHKKGYRDLIAKKALKMEFGNPVKKESPSKENKAPEVEIKESEIILNLKEHISDLKNQLQMANELNKQLLQSMRIEQVKTLTESDKDKIINVLNGK